jgi:hypothetical protein
MVTWTLVVKYLAPLLWLAAQRHAGDSAARAPIMWDLWPLAHLALATLLWRQHPWAWRLGVAVAAAEVAIVLVKLSAWLADPARDFWSLLWASNKLYVLAYFLWLLAVLLRRGPKALVAPAPSEVALS